MPPDFHSKDAAALCACNGAPKVGYAVPCVTCGGIRYVPIRRCT